MLCVSARRLGSSQVVAVDPKGFRHRTPRGRREGGALRGVGQIMPDEAICRHLARGHCTGYAIVPPTQAWAARQACGLKTRPADILTGSHAPACCSVASRRWSIILEGEPSLGGKRLGCQVRHRRVWGVAAKASLVVVVDPSAKRLSAGRPRPRRMMDILFGGLYLHRVLWGPGTRASTAATVRETWVVQSLIRRSASFVVEIPQPGPAASTTCRLAGRGFAVLRGVCGVGLCQASFTCYLHCVATSAQILVYKMHRPWPPCGSVRGRGRRGSTG